MKLVSKRGKRDSTQKLEISYPETQWSEEQMRALQMAAESNVADHPISEEAASQSFEHLAPPKKSFIKITLLVLLILTLVAAAGFGGWYYWWTNHATFEYDLKPVVILYGQSVTPSEFLTDKAIAEGISAEFQNPDFAPVQGRVTVPLVLELGWRSLETTATLYVMIPVIEILHEFREEAPEIDPFSLISNAEIARGILYDVDFTDPPLPLTDYLVGEYTLHLALNGTPFAVTLIIEDTLPPTATAVPVIIDIGESVEPEDFVTDVDDPSPIASIVFSEEPDTLAQREQLVEVIITDIFGNSAIFASSLTIVLNDAPPIIAGINPLESMVGQEVEYGIGVTAFDSFLREIEFYVDDSGVDIDEEGLYEAFYIAQDLTGNVTSEPFSVRIIGADPVEVNRQVDNVLRQILSNDMTTVEKIRAIHTYIRELLTLEESDVVPVSLYEPAFQALDTKRGDSHVYSALAEVMLTRAEIPNMRVYRSSEFTAHVWNLVSPDDSESWYHFDATPTPIQYREITAAMYMFTAAQAKDFAVRVVGRGGNTTMYFAFDTELYPEIVAE